MGDTRPDGDSELQRQVDDLRERMAANRSDIDALLARADKSDHRAEMSEARADVADQRADASEALSVDDRRRITDLETHVDVDRAMILELRAEGLISQQHAAQLQEALHTSRRIGAAIGIIMANRGGSEADAFLTLSRASQNTNRKVRVVADEVVETGDVSDLP
jgi:hypothetical protein